jgi:hypothetical protein
VNTEPVPMKDGIREMGGEQHARVIKRGASKINATVCVQEQVRIAL